MARKFYVISREIRGKFGTGRPVASKQALTVRRVLQSVVDPAVVGGERPPAAAGRAMHVSPAGGGRNGAIGGAQFALSLSVTSR